MHIKPFQAIYPNLDYITSADSFFGTVKEEFPDYMENGFFIKTAREALYIYRMIMPQRSYTGLIACADIRDYLEGHIKKHEHTLPAKEQKQMQLMMRRKAAIKPVLLTYPAVKEIHTWMENYIKDCPVFLEIHFEEEKETHQVWEIRAGEEILAIQQLFAEKVPNTYIADGHHRTTTTALLFERTADKDVGKGYDLLFSAFFPSDELDIHDYNRVVEGLNEISATRFMARLSAVFEITPLKKAVKPRKKHEITMLINREWYRLHWRSHILEEYRKEKVVLDSMLLDEKVLNEILGIEDVRNDSRISYVEGPKGTRLLSKKVLKTEHSIGFCLYPVHLEEMINMANEGMVLPPKSTWFEPRMRNGILVQPF